MGIAYTWPDLDNGLAMAPGTQRRQPCGVAWGLAFPPETRKGMALGHAFSPTDYMASPKHGLTMAP